MIYAGQVPGGSGGARPSARGHKQRSQLRVGTWNVRSIRSQIDQENLLADLRGNKIDVAMVQETRLGELGNLVDSHGYEIHLFKDSLWSKAVGGLGIFIRKGGKIKVQSAPVLVTKRIVKLEIAVGGQNITFLNIYAPHTGRELDEERQTFWNSLRKAIHDIKGQSIICGDFNAELPRIDGDLVVGQFAHAMLSHGKNTTALREITENAGYKDSLSRTQARWARMWTYEGHWALGRTKKVIDHIFYSSGLANPSCANVKRRTLHNSDHKLVVATFPIQWKFQKPNPSVQHDIARRLMRTPEGQSRLQKKLEANPATCMKELTEKILEVAREGGQSGPTKRKPWISDNTMDLVQQRQEVELDTSKTELTKMIKQSAKNDRIQRADEVITDMKKAYNSGARGKVYGGIKELGGAKRSNDIIYPNEQNAFREFNEKLFAHKDNTELAEIEHQNTLGWKKCEEKLQSQPENQWRVDKEAPTKAELDEAIGRLKIGKSCAGLVPAELAKSSGAVRDILFDMICRIWRGEEEEYDWASAEIKLLHKKGPKTEPKNYRPIALLNIAENLLSSIIYKRIINAASERLDQRQVGFLPGRSGRTAVNKLLRTINKAIFRKSQKILVFVDFEKAFDSLLHTTMFSTLQNSGCPTEILEVIKNIYGRASIKLKYGNGDQSGPIPQRRGIRQGSALSPLLFIICLDWALKRASEAMEDAGINSEQWDWGAYADDIALEALTEKVAQFSVTQLEAACVFIGLRISGSKTEVMPINVTTKRTEAAKAKKWDITYREGRNFKQSTRHALGNRVFQSKDRVAAEGQELGQMVDYNGIEKAVPPSDAQQIMGNEDAKKRATHAILMKTSVEEAPQWRAAEATNVKASGGFKIQMDNGEWVYHTVTKLAYERYVDESKNKFVCQGCSILFYDQEGLRAHHKPRNCCKMDCRTMPINWQIQRESYAKKKISAKLINAGQKEEEISIKTTNGQQLPCCGEFKYLGTMAAWHGRMDEEIKRRSDLARAKTYELRKIWKSRILPARIKREIFKMLILSVLFYNVETWVLTATNREFLRKNYAKLVKIAFQGGKITGKDGKVERDEILLARHKLDPVDLIIANRKVAWVAHIIRGNENTAKDMLQNMKNENNDWWRSYVQELKAFNTEPQDIEQNASQKQTIRNILRKNRDPVN